MGGGKGSGKAGKGKKKLDILKRPYLLYAQRFTGVLKCLFFFFACVGGDGAPSARPTQAF